MSNLLPQPRIVAIAGGKGGVGKSVVAAALGISLARQGAGVVLVDLDLGAGNLHTYLGLRRRTASIADFLQRKVADLSSLCVPTAEPGLRLISGAEFAPGMANPPHWMKLKLLRQIRRLPAEVVILDLGAGVHFNTLDFYLAADQGLLVATPEPASVMNAYGFLKAALLRHLHRVFKNHPQLEPVLAGDTGAEMYVSTLEGLAQAVQDHAPELTPLLQEVRDSFSPGLVGNRMPPGQPTSLLQNLCRASASQLGLELHEWAALPEASTLGRHLLDLPGFLRSAEAAPFAAAVQALSRALSLAPNAEPVRSEFADAELAEFSMLLDALDDSVFQRGSRDAWKLRLYFKPATVVAFLRQHGIRHVAFAAA